MAFVVQSKRETVIAAQQRNSSKLIVGPGSYDPEATAHKELMSALYPKKQVPFNTNSPKNSSLLKQASLDVPGKFVSYN